MDNLTKLEGCDVHATYIVPDSELNTLSKLKLNLSCDAVYFTDSLY